MARMAHQSGQLGCLQVGQKRTQGPVHEAGAKNIRLRLLGLTLGSRGRKGEMTAMLIGTRTRPPQRLRGLRVKNSCMAAGSL